MSDIAALPFAAWPTGRKIAAGTSTRTGRFWRMTNEIPFLLAIIMVLSVTTEWTF